MSASLRETGSRPSGHAASGVDGGPRFDPALTLGQHLEQVGEALEWADHEITVLRELIRECRLADAHAARTGDESRFDRAFHALCLAERGVRNVGRQ